MRIDKDKLYTTKEVAGILGVSETTVKRYITNYKIGSIKLNGLQRIRGLSILNTIKKNSTIYIDSKEPKKYVEENPYCWKGEPMFISSEARSKSKYIVCDLFSGAGGFSVGFSKAGFGIALGVDNHVPSKETFTINHKESEFLLGDIRKIDTERIKNIFEKKKLSVIVAGIPCQGFSLNNRKRRENDERNFLFTEFIRFIKKIQPPYVLIENVSGIKSTGNGHFVKAIKGEIENCGYDVDSRFLNAADYGVPQKRIRIFFMGALTGYQIRWPAPTHGPGRQKKYDTVGDAISDLPSLESGEEKTSYDKQPSTEYQELMREKSGERLHNHKAPNHPRSTVERIANTKPGEPMYKTFLQRIRLKADVLSPTQVAGGIRPQFTFGHPTQPRGLSVRERARIQSFPDDFVFYGGLVQERVQTGNAVPPLLAKAIAEQIMKGLKHEPMDKQTIKKRHSQVVLIQ